MQVTELLPRRRTLHPVRLTETYGVPHMMDTGNICIVHEPDAARTYHSSGPRANRLPAGSPLAKRMDAAMDEYNKGAK